MKKAYFPLQSQMLLLVAALTTASSPALAAALTGKVTAPEGKPAYGAMLTVFDEAKEKREIEATLGKASPRKPKLKTCSKSSKLLILLVACRVSASVNSRSSMPAPLSLMRIRRAPPPLPGVVLWRLR